MKFRPQLVSMIRGLMAQVNHRHGLRRVIASNPRTFVTGYTPFAAFVAARRATAWSWQGHLGVYNAYRAGLAHEGRRAMASGGAQVPWLGSFCAASGESTPI